MEATRLEYLNILTELLTAPIYQGLASVYDLAIKHKNEYERTENELNIFKDFLRTVVPKWTESILEREVNRIREVTKQGTHLDQLFKATLKASILVLTRASDHSVLKHVSQDHWKNARFETFIHKCYIFAAREVYNAPYLFARSEALEMARERQKEAVHIIQRCVENALRHSLPLSDILKDFMEEPEKKNQATAFSNTVPLLDEEGKNQMEKVFSTYNIRESVPRNFTPKSSLAPIPSAASSNTRGGQTASHKNSSTMRKKGHSQAPTQHTPALSHHTITNFLMNDPNIIQSESIVQSPVD